MAEEPGEQSQSLFRPPMSDPELDLEHWHGARPKVAGPLTTQTIQEEARAAPTEEHVLQLRGTDFYLPLGGQPRILERKSWRAPIVTEQGNPGIYVQIDEWLPLYKGNIYVVDEVTGQMYLSKGEHLMRIAGPNCKVIRAHLSKTMSCPVFLSIQAVPERELVVLMFCQNKASRIGSLVSITLRQREEPDIIIHREPFIYSLYTNRQLNPCTWGWICS